MPLTPSRPQIHVYPLSRLVHAPAGGWEKLLAKIAGNEAAFRMFVDVFHPKIKKFKRSFLRDFQRGVEFEGILLAGLPHLEVVDEHGNTRYVFLHAADWDSDDLKAYLELLAVIIERKYGASASDLWCMDLKTGETTAFKGSKRIRKRCVDAARHFARFMSAPE